jgi:DNA-binding transcriptional MerR regulator
MNDAPENAVYTVGQVAARLQCSVRSLYRWEEEGVIPKAERIDCGAVRTRVYNEIEIEEIRKRLKDRLKYSTAVRRDARISTRERADHGGAWANSKLAPGGPTERQRVATNLAGELGLHAFFHCLPDPQARLGYFILRSIEKLDRSQWASTTNRLLSETGIATNQELVRWLDLALEQFRKCLTSQVYVAAAMLFRRIIEIAIEWAADPQYVVSCIHDLALVDSTSVETAHKLRGGKRMSVKDRLTGSSAVYPTKKR